MASGRSAQRRTTTARVHRRILVVDGLRRQKRVVAGGLDGRDRSDGNRRVVVHRACSVA
jgi:hypothetical protein